MKLWQSTLVWTVCGGAIGSIVAQGLYDSGVIRNADTATACALAAIVFSGLVGYAADPAIARHLITFRSPLQRIAFLIALASAVWLLGVAAWRSDSVIRIIGDGLSFHRWRAPGSATAAYGFAAGTLFAYGYDMIVAPLLAWIWRPQTEANDSTEPENLYFKDAQSAVSYAASHLQSEIRQGEILPCRVEDARIDPSFGPIAIVQVPHLGETKQIMAALPSSEDPASLVGTLCAAYIGPCPRVAGADHAAMLVAILEPIWTRKGWKILRHMESTAGPSKWRPG